MSVLEQYKIARPEMIERYSLRSETDADILKLYYRKERKDLFQRTLKLRFPRQLKSVRVDGGMHRYETVTEISPGLARLLEELDGLTRTEVPPEDVAERIRSDLRHLEKVVVNKIREIEKDLALLEKS